MDGRHKAGLDDIGVVSLGANEHRWQFSFLGYRPVLIP
jgi:hypothetical protein